MRVHTTLHITYLLSYSYVSTPKYKQVRYKLQALPIVDRQYEHVELVCTIPM